MTMMNRTMRQQINTPLRVDEPPYRTFICVGEPNTRFQIGVGDPELNKPIITLDGPIQQNIRVGDKFVAFMDGLFATNDPACITWCESQYPYVIDSEAAERDVLIQMAKLQTPTESYEPESSIDLLNVSADAIQVAVNAAVAKELERRGLSPDFDVKVED